MPAHPGHRALYVENDGSLTHDEEIIAWAVYTDLDNEHLRAGYYTEPITASGVAVEWRIEPSGKVFHPGGAYDNIRVAEDDLKRKIKKEKEKNNA